MLYEALLLFVVCFFFFNDTATTEIYTLSLHDALPISNTLPRYHSLLAILPLQSGKDLIAGAVDSLAEQKIERNVCRLMLARRATSVGNDRRRKPPQTVIGNAQKPQKRQPLSVPPQQPQHRSMS